MVNQAFNKLSSLATWENAASALEMAAGALLVPIELRNRSAELYRLQNAIEALKRAGIDTPLVDVLKDELKYYRDTQGVWVQPYVEIEIKESDQTHPSSVIT